ncbi:MAG TPA: EscU/YscU/HrcU family type III secretion system export apparatus switch protein [Actinobacteria bacterium]|nr:EscU/YscU/HrcU family type III secretion system export apparatus switch protein [Actinomycetota bacterium]
MTSRSQDRTEKATPRRRREARREGRVARSPEVAIALSMVALLAVVRFVAPLALPRLAVSSRRLFLLAGAARFTDEFRAAVVELLVMGVVPVLLLAVLLGIAGGVLQVGFHLAPKTLRPTVSNLSPAKGLQQFKPTVFGWNLLKTSAKLGLLALVVWAPLQEALSGPLVPVDLATAAATVGGVGWRILVGATLLAVVVAGADFGFAWWRNEKELRMTRQELKEEHKNTEGDPLVRQQRRRRAAELSRNRMIFAVASADVVVTNPTHLAVALRYGPGDPAPKVVAKGADAVALRIRTEAYRHGVVVVEDKPVARALFRTVKLDHYVPAALFEAVAAVLAVAYRRRGRRVA